MFRTILIIFGNPEKDVLKIITRLNRACVLNREEDRPFHFPTSLASELKTHCGRAPYVYESVVPLPWLAIRSQMYV